jgi:hypothetical protein
MNHTSTPTKSITTLAAALATAALTVWMVNFAARPAGLYTAVAATPIAAHATQAR